MKNQNQSYSFCETATAGPLARWHIRPLTPAGRKLGGGADTQALCKRVVAWDLTIEITNHHLTHCCPPCASIFREQQSQLSAGPQEDGQDDN